MGLSYLSFASGSILPILARVVDPEIHHLVGSTSSPLARMENQPSREEDVEVDVDEDEEDEEDVEVDDDEDEEDEEEGVDVEVDEDEDDPVRP